MAKNYTLTFEHFHVILMLSRKDKYFLSQKDTTLPSYNSQSEKPYIDLMLYLDSRT